MPTRRYAPAKYTAKKRGLELTVTQEQFFNLLKSPCAYCGDLVGDVGVSMDRKDSSLGYTIENVVPCGNI